MRREPHGPVYDRSEPVGEKLFAIPQDAYTDSPDPSAPMLAWELLYSHFQSEKYSGAWLRSLILLTIQSDVDDLRFFPLRLVGTSWRTDRGAEIRPGAVRRSEARLLYLELYWTHRVFGQGLIVIIRGDGDGLDWPRKG